MTVRCLKDIICSESFNTVFTKGVVYETAPKKDYDPELYGKLYLVSDDYGDISYYEKKKFEVVDIDKVYGLTKTQMTFLIRVKNMLAGLNEQNYGKSLEYDEILIVITKIIHKRKYTEEERYFINSDEFHSTYKGLLDDEKIK